MKIYVASSWRNPKQPEVVKALREAGHEVYDFRAPSVEHGTPGGFHWSEIDPAWRDWSPEEYRRGITHPLARHGLHRDFEGMRWCDVVVMVHPCGVSAALELGWCIGAGRRALVLLDGGERFEPELMFGLADALCVSIEEVIDHLGYLAYSGQSVLG